jgi:hypothetical protein
MFAAVDHKIERFQTAVTAWIPEIDHRNIMIVNITDQVGFGKLVTGFIKVLNQ